LVYFVEKIVIVLRAKDRQAPGTAYAHLGKLQAQAIFDFVLLAVSAIVGS
jgi:hypothetical protein